MSNLFPSRSTGFMTMYDLQHIMKVSKDVIEDIKGVFDDYGIELMEGGKGNKTASYLQNGVTADYLYFTITLRNFEQVDTDANLRTDLKTTTRLQLIEEKTIGRHWVGYYKVKTMNDYRTKNQEDVTQPH
jgi:hypothetical protein